MSLFVVFYLLAPQVARWRRRPFDSLAARGSLTAPLLFFMFPALAALEPRTESPALLFGTLLALAAASGAVAVLEENGPLHFLAAFFAVAAEAVWSAKHLTPERLPAGLALRVVRPLLPRRPGAGSAPRKAAAPRRQRRGALVLQPGDAAVPGGRRRRAHGPLGNGTPPRAAQPRAFLRGAHSRMPLVAVASIILSWVVIGVWWATAMVTSLLLPALVIVAGFAPS